MAITINSLEIENVKRIKAVKVEPSSSGLTIIGGDNGQGKTSVLDAIAWALGGNRYKPSQAQRDGAMASPALKLTLSNGLVVERKGKNSALKVIDPNGQKAGQQLLDSFVEELAINLPKFMDSSPKEKADILLQIIGVGDQLFQLETQEKTIYNNRHAVGVIADQKEKYAKEQPFYEDAPKELISLSELILQQQKVLARNGENERKRQNLAGIQQSYNLKNDEVNQLRARLAEAEQQLQQLSSDLAIAQSSVVNLQDESTAEIEQNIANIEQINLKVRANLSKEKAEEDAKAQRQEYKALTEKLEAVRKEKQELLTTADLPLPGLSVVEGELVYNGQRWDNMSGSEQLMVSTAIVRKLKPECGFVLIDKLEQMDQKSLQLFGAWLESEGLQAIATRVSRGDECSIIIEDGYSVENESYQPVVPQAPKTWEGTLF